MGQVAGPLAKGQWATTCVNKFVPLASGSSMASAYLMQIATLILPPCAETLPLARTSILQKRDLRVHASRNTMTRLLLPVPTVQIARARSLIQQLSILTV